MSFLLVAAVLAANPEPVASYQSVQEAAQALKEETQTGTLIFSKGDCLAVKVFSISAYTHVAAVVMQEGKPIVYDSMNGVGVRKQSLQDYLDSQNPDLIHLAHPSRQFTGSQSRAFGEHLDQQLGRPYAIKHHLTGNRGEGLHCAEYVTDALMVCRLLQAKEPSRVSPASLAEGLFRDELYASARTVELRQPSAEKQVGGNWCEQLWIDTKTCTVGCCVKMRRWFLCR